MFLHCPICYSTKIKKNGHIHNGKQNHACNDCGRQFVLNPQNQITEAAKEKIDKLLLERLSLRGICRVMSVSLSWLMVYIVKKYESLPEYLNVVLNKKMKGVVIQVLESEADEMWSFVGKKESKQWIWVAIDAQTKQVLAFHIGSRGKQSAQKLWNKIPKQYRQKATFYTDNWKAYKSVIPKKRHIISKAKTTHIERFFCTLRQRVSRVVRLTLSFSKKLENHIGAIKYFICDYNFQIALRL